MFSMPFLEWPGKIEHLPVLFPNWKDAKAPEQIREDHDGCQSRPTDVLSADGHKKKDDQHKQIGPTDKPEQDFPFV